MQEPWYPFHYLILLLYHSEKICNVLYAVSFTCILLCVPFILDSESLKLKLPYTFIQDPSGKCWCCPKQEQEFLICYWILFARILLRIFQTDQNLKFKSMWQYIGRKIRDLLF